MSDPICTPRSRGRRGVAAGIVAALAGLLTVAVVAVAPAASASTASAGKLAAANVGKTAGYCAVHPTKNSLGGSQFATSCDGHLGKGKSEYWCADFARWVWGASGLSTTGLSAAAASFDSYGSTNHSITSTPAVGDAVTFAHTRGGYAHHVGVITAVSSSSVTIANGDWNGSHGTESTFGRTSKVVSITISRSSAKAGTYVSSFGLYLSHIIAPAGHTSPGANPYTPGQACGAGYSVIDHHALTGATVYLLYKSTGTNCVVTLASKVGGKVAMSAHLQVKGKAVKTNSGSFTYYAGPVSAAAAKKCVKWGGSYKTSSWTSAYSHCG